SDDTGLHPALAPLRKPFEDGRLAVVRGVGPPQPDRSHFRSMEIWHTASLADPAPPAGWIGTAAPRLGAGVPGVRARGRHLPLAVAGSAVQAPALASLDDLLLRAAGGGSASAQRARLARACSGRAGRSGESAWLADAADEALDISDRLRGLHASAQAELPGGEL